MNNEEKSLFERAIAIDPDDALKAALEAESTEEKSFFTYIASMNLRLRSAQEFRESIDKQGGERT